MASLGASVVSNARFRPFSYQEMLAPLAAYTQEYNTIQEGLSNLGDASNTFSQYIDPNSRSGQAVAAYNQQLQDAAADMSANGLGVTNRDTLYGLKREYNNNISKINKAAQSLDTMYKAMQQGKMRDPSLMIGKMPTVDELVDNPGAAPTTVSGNQLYAYGAKAAQAASMRNFLHSEKGAAFRGMYQHIADTQGYNSEAMQKFLQDMSTIPELQAALSQIKDMTGVGNLNTGDQARSESYILNGMLSGATYSQKDNYIADVAAQKALEQQYAIQRMDHQAEINQNQAILEGYLKGTNDLNGNPTAPGGGAPNYGTTSESVMDTNGDLSGHLNDIHGLMGKYNGKFAGASAAIWGKDSRVNPMKVYEDYQKDYNSALAAYKRSHHARKGSGVDWANDDQIDVQRINREAAAHASKVATEKMRAKGVTKLITKSQYETMADLGYSSSTDFSASKYKYGSAIMNEMQTKLNQKNSSTSIYNIAGEEGTKRVAERLYSGLATANANNAWEGRVNKLDRNLNKGEDGDIDDFNSESNPIVSVGVTSKYDDALVVKTKDGQRWLIDPSLVDNETANIVRDKKNQRTRLIKDFETTYGRQPTEAEKQAIDKQLNQIIAHRVMAQSGINIDQALTETSSKAE